MSNVIVTVIQARMGSTRLPGKVLRDLGGRSVLSWVIRAAQASSATEHVVVATSVDASDDVVAAHAESLGAGVVRGSEADVLARFLTVVDTYHPDAVVRLTADCPLLDPDVIRMCVRAFDAGSLDYLSTVTPRTLPHGLDVEVVSTAALRVAGEHATGADRAHVTTYVWQRPQRFRIAGLTFAPAADDLRVTLDTVDDGLLLDAVVAGLGTDIPRWRDLTAFLRSRPDITALNAHVMQKPIEAG